MNDEERRHYARDGFLLREAVFAAAELQELRGVFEEVVARVKRRAARPDAGPEIQLADGHRLQLSSQAAIQWEWDERAPGRSGWWSPAIICTRASSNPCATP